MPIDEAAGCLVGVFRFLAGILEFLTEAASADFVGWIGKWTLRGVTMGRYKGRSEDLGSVLAGLAVIGIVITAALWLA